MFWAQLLKNASVLFHGIICNSFSRCCCPEWVKIQLKACQCLEMPFFITLKSLNWRSNLVRPSRIIMALFVHQYRKDLKMSTGHFKVWWVTSVPLGMCLTTYQLTDTVWTRTCFSFSHIYENEKSLNPDASSFGANVALVHLRQSVFGILGYFTYLIIRVPKHYLCLVSLLQLAPLCRRSCYQGFGHFRFSESGEPTEELCLSLEKLLHFLSCQYVT